ncbi:helix-turn-helix domain-containing protein [Falsirhodobacter sp. 1013]|uniref:helix-turn-helix domain-containing protein n=1 Tax=Falsirhodobacter sp. 1013 TaxID=3417566 RepID=UPI003EC07076
MIRYCDGVGVEPAIAGLTLDQLTIFLAVAEQGRFSAAARHLRRTHSAITYGIQNLERRWGPNCLAAPPIGLR